MTESTLRTGTWLRCALFWPAVFVASAVLTFFLMAAALGFEGGIGPLAVGLACCYATFYLFFVSFPLGWFARRSWRVRWIPLITSALFLAPVAALYAWWTSGMVAAVATALVYEMRHPR